MRSPKGLRRVLGVLLGSAGGQGESGQGWRVPREVPGVLKEPLEFDICFLLDVKLLNIHRNICVFSSGAFCEAASCFLIMVLVFVFLSFEFCKAVS